MSKNETLLLAAIKLVAKHEAVLTSLSQVLIHVIRVVFPDIRKCEHSTCDKPATVKHQYLNVTFCDHHTAKAIVNAAHNFINADKLDTMNDVRSTIMREDDWVDVENAESIRSLETYVEMIKSVSDQQKIIH